MVTASLASELRREQTALADRVTVEMLGVYGALNFKALDVSSPGFIEAAVAVAERGHREASALGGDMYLSMRRDAGVAGQFDVARPKFDAVQLRRDLTVLGPVAAKKLLSRGERIPDAAKSVFTLTSGRVSKTALQGTRDAISGSSGADQQAVAYARQVRAGACDFCVLLAENTYRSAESAMFAAGTRGRAKAPQPAGATFHDHCRCTLVPLFQGQIAPGSRDRQAFIAQWVSASKQGMSYRDFAEKSGLTLGY